MVDAVRAQVRWHAGPVWGRLPVPVELAPQPDELPQHDEGGPPVVVPPDAGRDGASWVINILDDADQANVLGYHAEDQAGRAYGRVFARSCLDNGGTVTQGAWSVSTVLSHEALEILIDPSCALWADDRLGFTSVEVADPVEGSWYDMTVGTEQVSVSNYVLPSWFDSAGRPPYDRLETLSRPFEIAADGYALCWRRGRVSQVFGDQLPEWKRATKTSPLARTARRLERRPQFAVGTARQSQ